MEREKIIRIKVNMKDPKGLLIPVGVTETLTAEIANGVATFRFKDARTTKRIALIEIQENENRGKEANTIYMERFQKAITRYPGKTKEEIRDHLLNLFKQMGVNVKLKDE